MAVYKVKHNKVYIRAVNKESAPRKSLKNFAIFVLSELGINAEIVNLKEDGITIPSLNQFVKIIYDLGFEDGERQFSSSQLIKQNANKIANGLSKQNSVGRLMSNMEKN